MSLPVGVIIRKFEIEDREAVRKISCETSFLEYPRKIFFENDEILADALTLYFTDYEPESCFVVEKDKEIVGYILGAKDVKIMNKIMNFRIIPRLFLKIIFQGTFLKPRTRLFLIHGFISFLKGEFFFPDFSFRYPATLHINIQKNFRSQNIGHYLMRYYLDYLRENRIKGVHLGTISERARVFFLKQGFHLLYEARRSYLRYYIGKDIPFYILGREL